MCSFACGGELAQFARGGDLARHGKSGTSTYCKPKPPMTAPARPPYVGARYAAIPGQPRYGVATAYTGSIKAPEQVLITEQEPSFDASPFFPAGYDPTPVGKNYDPPAE